MLHGLPDLFLVQIGGSGQTQPFQHRLQPRPDGLAAHGQQADGNALAVVQAALCGAFHAVTDGVTEVQQLADAALPFILLYDGFFDGQRTIQQLFHRQIALLQLCKQLLVRGQRHLDGLCHALGIEPGGQGVQRIGVDEHLLRLPEGTHDVFHPIQIDAGLAADGGVHLRQQSGGDVVKIHPPHKAGGGKPCQIAHHTAAHGGNAVLAGKAPLQHHPAQLGDGFHGLGLLTGVHRDDHRAFALSSQLFHILPGHALVGDDAYLTVQVEQPPSLLQTAPLNQNIIAALAQLHVQNHRPTSSPMRQWARKEPATRTRSQQPSSSCSMARPSSPRRSPSSST